ncbi:tetratricopeptide repeat protein [Thermodesulfatator atlanticus]|uniref:tetratricopeptide repeat protein n=1 Tax=Thermodesulfatator atlanticus TaxID=501497 RepID=UPI0003B47BA1|nr:tetratricopeptide repeat protein [Thermodesulfatator atlanticus]
MAEEKKKTETASEPELLVLHERWVEAARSHLKEIIAAAIAIVLVVAAWSGFDYYRKKKADDAALLYAQALMTKDEQTRTRILNDVVKKYSGTPAALEARMDLFDEYLAKGKIDLALKELEKINQKAKIPLKEFSSLGVGYLKEEQRKFNEAEKFYQEAAKAHIGLEKVAYWDLARAAELANKKKEALKYYEKLLGLKPAPEVVDFIQVKLARFSENLSDKGS